jgi:hypothetical protein
MATTVHKVEGRLLIKGVAYNDTKGTLTVNAGYHFILAYTGVPEATYKAFMADGFSKSYYDEHIKGKYKFKTATRMPSTTRPKPPTASSMFDMEKLCVVLTLNI